MKTKLLSLKELRTKKPAELQNYVSQLERERTSLLHDIQTGKTKQTHLLKRIKRSTAQALTLAAAAKEAK